MMLLRHSRISRLLSLATLSSTAAAFVKSNNNNSSRRLLASSSSTATSLTMSSSQTFETGYLNAQDAADLDVELMSTPGFSLEQLMELAGLSVAEAVYDVAMKKSCKEDDDVKEKTKRVLLVCGPGNNGGDGLVAARHLFHFGLEPTVVYPKRSTKTHFINLVQQLEDLNIPILDEIPATSTSSSSSNDDNEFYDVIVDAIFGFSFRGTAPREPFATAITQMVTMQKEQNSLLVSVDVPSSWNVDGGDLTGAGFQPDVLISLTAPKLSAKKFTGRHFIGGRFLPPGLAAKYRIQMPPYPGVSQVVEIPKLNETPNKEDVSDSEVDWALEYQAFLEEKEKARDDENDEDESKRDNKEKEGEEWAKEYADYCNEKEKEFFDANTPKE